MSDQRQQKVPLATPYPWAPNEPQIFAMAHSSTSTHCKRKGSGVIAVYRYLEDENTSKRAKETLSQLMGEELAEQTPTQKKETLGFATESLAQEPDEPFPQAIDPSASPPLSDDTILRMAQLGKLSLLGSILRVVRDSPSSLPVTTRQILKTCGLAVPPGNVPANLDAKEIVLAALYFLSTSHKSEQWTLPLIRSVHEDNDLEKRTYEACDEKYPSKSQLQWLEIAFWTSTDKYTPREKYCPRHLSPEEQGALLLKGTVPVSASAKSTGTKRKSQTAKRSSEPTSSLSM